ncbi:plasmid partitioning protein RepB C-terminal domain-containing protein [Novosphingobium sp. SG720]|uniref:ParB/RepB/Spo0J family partition protein n=1 Tax=Novosphingobium sp. SG720 TaxID=2586998 RepID=UPI0014465634|nr:plasmid partitioning protein RepB C-terminal domain-containing protein [Novosphingobium sp. SG720]NKJ44831.1 ParB family chromosome partitioning protein [Novosphingobium sp. SG720]
MSQETGQTVAFIAIDSITVVNPRSRPKRSFKEMVDSIASVGLKKPITVTRSRDQGAGYDLVCGQGRLEAFRLLGEKTIPAFVVDLDPQESLIASLVENFARRQLRGVDLLHDIGAMKQRGHTEAEITRMTGLSSEYVKGIIHLLEKGEQRLLQSVEAGIVPVAVAVQIADADDIGVQEALQQAYERNELRGKRLLAAKRLVDRRAKYGNALVSNLTRKPKISSMSLVRAYEQDTERKRMLIRKAEATKARLLLITAAMREMMRDEALVEIMQQEGLATMPKVLSDRVFPGRIA